MVYKVQKYKHLLYLWLYGIAFYTDWLLKAVCIKLIHIQDGYTYM